MKRSLLITLLTVSSFVCFSQYNFDIGADFALPLSKMKQFTNSGIGITSRGSYSLNSNISAGIGYNFLRFGSPFYASYYVHNFNISGRYTFNSGFYGEIAPGFSIQQITSDVPIQPATTTEKDFCFSSLIGYAISLNKAENICFDLGVGYNLLFAKADNLSYINIKVGLIFLLGSKKY